jgi:hypothetical protein
VIECSIVGTHSSRKNPKPLSWNKAIRNFLLDVDLMGMIILELRPNVSVVFIETLFCPR